MHPECARVYVAFMTLDLRARFVVRRFACIDASMHRDTRKTHSTMPHSSTLQRLFDSLIFIFFNCFYSVAIDSIELKPRNTKQYASIETFYTIFWYKSDHINAITKLISKFIKAILFTLKLYFYIHKKQCNIRRIKKYSF